MRLPDAVADHIASLRAATLHGLKVALIAAPLLGAFYHFATWLGPEPMPWWPDTVIFTGYMGVLAGIIGAGHHAGRRGRERRRRLFTGIVRGSRGPDPASHDRPQTKDA